MIEDSYPWEDQARYVLRGYFGYSDFRPFQREVMNSILSKKNTLAVMPTGFGKSLCFQIPAMLLPGITLVISPLISLMKDQVDVLRKKGVPASLLNSTINLQERRQSYQDISSGNCKILYVTPERLDMGNLSSFLGQHEISMVAIDEAHCVSQWGHDFRPSYQGIASFLDRFNKKPIVSAFTATATTEVQRDIISVLGLNDAELHIGNLDRPNLSFKVIRNRPKLHELEIFAKKHRNDSGIVYVSTRKEVSKVYHALDDMGIPVSQYHAGLSLQYREKAQDDFLSGRTKVIVATNAFGMGIDKPDIRYVVHYNMPKNIEAYYQEAGRAGRDGNPAECVLLFADYDIKVQKFLIEQSTDDLKRRYHQMKLLQKMVNYCNSSKCLRKYILEYFGENYPKDNCANCGNCIRRR